MKNRIEKAKAIRLIIFDVDGVLSTGILFYGLNGAEYKTFHVHDGQGMKLLAQSGVHIAIITGHQSDIITRRMKDLEIAEYVYQGQTNKIPAYEELKTKLHLTDAEIAYVGDDLPDLPLIRRAGFGITVASAPSVIQKHAHWVTEAKGGEGAVREICDFIMQAQGTYEPMVEKHLC